MKNLILDTDSYKFSHYLQYPDGTEKVFSYLEARKGSKYGSSLFFGLQLILKSLANGVSKEDISEAKDIVGMHGLPFNEDGWNRLVEKHNGKLPVEIRAVPEGTIVPVDNVLLTVENTDPEFYWLVSYLETMIMRVWYPTTVSTQSYIIKQVIKSFLEETSDNINGLDFMLHDFGARGVSSHESAGIGGLAHLVNFKGTDTVAALVEGRKSYNEPMAGFSVPASEHTTILLWGPNGEKDAYQNMLKKFGKPGSIVSVVSDTYDIYNAVENIWGNELKDEVISSGATLVVRPDSGNPKEVVSKVVSLLANKFGFHYNTKGYKVLNNVKVIQGDGVNIGSITEILSELKANRFSSENMVFGMGGALLQKVDRDTQRFAYKTSSALISGNRIDVRKNPITDPTKASKAGRVDLIKTDTGFKTVSATEYHPNSMLKTVFKNGKLFNETTLQEVRDRAK